MSARFLFPFLMMMASLSLASCSSPVDDVSSLVVIDLNRTVSKPMVLSAVVSDSAIEHVITPNCQGSYVFSSDTIHSGIYRALWDFDHYMPLLIHRGECQKICGTWQQWDKHTVSSSETEMLWKADRIRQRLNVGRDSLVAHINAEVPHFRTILADSINALRTSLRAEADALLSRCDTSMAALSVVGIRELFDIDSDFVIFNRIMDNLVSRYENSRTIRRLRMELLERKKEKDKE